MSNAVSDYRPSCWLTCKLHDGTHFIFLYEPIPITQGESLFSFFFFLSGTRISFSVGAFWWLMPLPLIFLCFINKRTDGYFMFPGTTATTAAVILQRPTKIPPFPNTLVDVLYWTCTYFLSVVGWNYFIHTHRNSARQPQLTINSS